jgi:hypothetical protein
LARRFGVAAASHIHEQRNDVNELLACGVSMDDLHDHGSQGVGGVCFVLPLRIEMEKPNSRFRLIEVLHVKGSIGFKTQVFDDGGR